MARSIIIMMSLLAAPSSGLWITADGDQVEKPCPSALQMSDRARLPQGCVAHVQGVWLSRSTFKEGELERARLEEELLNARAREAALHQRIADLELQVSITGVQTVCPACNCTSQIITSAAVAVGGCALWTLSQ